MRAVFADTVFWVAVFRHKDPWKLAALHAKEVRPQKVRKNRLGQQKHRHECLCHTANTGLAGRWQRHSCLCSDFFSASQSRESFLRGLELYEARLDKDYSLTDCISMNVMRAASIDEALTNDRHFSQEGFTVLMTQKG